jgi:hypothetical protein
MATYSLKGSVVIVSASPIWGFADVPDAVSLEVTGRDSGVLTLRLLKSSKGNAVLTAFAMLGAVTPVMFPAIIIPGGINDFIWGANAIFGSGRGRIGEGTGGTIAWWRGATNMMPTTYAIGNEVGVVEWSIVLAGLNMKLFGG